MTSKLTYLGQPAPAQAAADVDAAAYFHVRPPPTSWPAETLTWPVKAAENLRREDNAGASVTRWQTANTAGSHSCMQSAANSAFKTSQSPASRALKAGCTKFGYLCIGALCAVQMGQTHSPLPLTQPLCRRPAALLHFWLRAPAAGHTSLQGFARCCIVAPLAAVAQKAGPSLSSTIQNIQSALQGS